MSDRKTYNFRNFGGGFPGAIKVIGVFGDGGIVRLSLSWRQYDRNNNVVSRRLTIDVDREDIVALMAVIKDSLEINS